MKIGTLITNERAYLDATDLLNALEAWKLGLGDKEAKVITAISNSIEKAIKENITP